MWAFITCTHLHKNALKKPQDDKENVGISKGNAHPDGDRDVDAHQKTRFTSKTIGQTAKEDTPKHDAAEVDGSGQRDQVPLVTDQVKLEQKSLWSEWNLQL